MDGCDEAYWLGRMAGAMFAHERAMLAGADVLAAMFADDAERCMKLSIAARKAAADFEQKCDMF